MENSEYRPSTESKMEQEKFKETERKYGELKEKLNHGEMTPEEMKKELKKMMVLDENGNYWMIGGKTGKWYSYNGTDWKEGDPYYVEPQEAAQESPHEQHEQHEQREEPAQSEQPVQSVISSNSIESGGTDTTESPGTETVSAVSSTDNVYREEIAGQREHSAQQVVSHDGISPDEKARMDTLIEESPDRQTICKVCKSKISLFSVYCQVCGANQKELAALSKKAQKPARGSELLITSIKPTSLIFFLGGLGLVLGVLLGAAFGVFNSIMPELPPQFPDMLADTRGGFAGGLIFAAIGGIAGFLLSAVTAGILALVYNGIAYLFGGIRLKIQQ